MRTFFAGTLLLCAAEALQAARGGALRMSLVPTEVAVQLPALREIPAQRAAMHPAASTIERGIIRCRITSFHCSGATAKETRCRGPFFGLPCASAAAKTRRRLVGKWKSAIEHSVALGFLPPTKSTGFIESSSSPVLDALRACRHTHPDHNIPRLMKINTEFKNVWRDVNALGAAAQSKTKLGGDMGRARVVSTIGSSACGAGLAVVLDLDGTCDVLHVVLSPDVCNADEVRKAEAGILRAIILEQAAKPVRLSSRAADALLSTELEIGFARPAEGAPAGWLVAE